MRRAVVVLALCASLSGSATSVSRAGSTSGELLFAADRVPRISGEIYRVDRNGVRRNLTHSPYADGGPVVAPDGRHVAFFSVRDDPLGDDAGRRAFVMTIDGARQEALPTPGPTSMAWAPDSRRLAVATLNRDSDSTVGTWVARIAVVVPAKSPRVVLQVKTPQAELSDLVWSPDGEALAVRAVHVLLVVRASGGTVFRIRVGDGARFGWSKLGRLAVVSGGRIRVYREDGTLLRAVAGKAFAWSGDGRKLAVVDGGFVEVFDASARRQTLRARVFSAKTVQRDVKAYGAYRPKLVWLDARRVGIVNVGGAGQSCCGPPSPYDDVDVAVDTATGARSPLPTWEWYAAACGCMSADGLVARAGKTSGGYALTISRPSGAGIHTLVRLAGCADGWAPPEGIQSVQFAGRSVVYASWCTEPQDDLFEAGVAGGRVRRLTRTSADEISPQWAPDGRSIVFLHAKAKGKECCPEAVWVAAPDATHARAITHVPDTDVVFDTSPTWSPDGRWIAFVRSTVSTPPVLRVISAAGGKPRSLHVQGGAPAWGPKIAYTNERGVWTIRPDGSDKTRIAGEPALALAWSRDGRLAYLARSGEHIVLVEPAAGRRTSLPFADANGFAWSPHRDGFAVSAKASLSGPSDVYVLDATGHVVGRVTFALGTTGISWR